MTLYLAKYKNAHTAILSIDPKLIKSFLSDIVWLKKL